MVHDLRAILEACLSWGLFRDTKTHLWNGSRTQSVAVLGLVGWRRLKVVEKRISPHCSQESKRERGRQERKMGVVAAIGVLLPFPFYYWLWTYPQTWVDLCGEGRDPSKVMAYVSHLLKLVQFLSLFSVSAFSWPPPLYFWPLIAFGQFLNFRLVSFNIYLDVL